MIIGLTYLFPKFIDVIPLFLSAGNAFGDGSGNDHSNGEKFSTKDRDQDTHSSGSCAISFEGAWWYSACHQSNLNGRYLNGPHSSFANGVNWKPWKGHEYSLKGSEMKIRKK